MTTSTEQIRTLIALTRIARTDILHNLTTVRTFQRRDHVFYLERLNINPSTLITRELNCTLFFTIIDKMGAFAFVYVNWHKSFSFGVS